MKTILRNTILAIGLILGSKLFIKSTIVGTGLLVANQVKSQSATEIRATSNINNFTYVFYKSLSPTNNPGNRWEILRVSKDSMNFRSPRIFLDTIGTKSHGNITGKLMWTDNNEIKNSPLSNLTLSISNIANLQDSLNVKLASEVDGSITNELEATGIIEFFAGTSAPTGYLLCDGSAVSRTTYSALFLIIGTTYGIGDGSTTFNVPDLRQKFPLGKAASGTGSVLGDTGGTIDHTHTVDPPNTTSGGPSTTVAATNLTGTAASTNHTHDVNISQFNSGSNNPPFIVLNAIIKY